MLSHNYSFIKASAILKLKQIIIKRIWCLPPLSRLMAHIIICQQNTLLDRQPLIIMTLNRLLQLAISQSLQLLVGPNHQLLSVVEMTTLNRKFCSLKSIHLGKLLIQEMRNKKLQELIYCFITRQRLNLKESKRVIIKCCIKSLPYKLMVNSILAINLERSLRN